MKRVAEEEIIEVEDLAAKQTKLDDEKGNSSGSQVSTSMFKRPTATNRNGLNQKSAFANLVKRKSTTTTSTTTSEPSAKSSVSSEITANNPTGLTATTTSTPANGNDAPKTNALSLLGSSYDNCTDSDESD